MEVHNLVGRQVHGHMQNKVENVKQKNLGEELEDLPCQWLM
jgi:hypothetical protein